MSIVGPIIDTVKCFKYSFLYWSAQDERTIKYPEKFYYKKPKFRGKLFLKKGERFFYQNINPALITSFCEPVSTDGAASRTNLFVPRTRVFTPRKGRRPIKQIGVFFGGHALVMSSINYKTDSITSWKLNF